MCAKILSFDAVQKKLNSRIKAINELNETIEVSFEDLFTHEFISNTTDFSNFSEFLEAGKFVINSPEDFNSISLSELDEHIISTTDFSSWEEMHDAAIEEYIASQVGI